MILGIDTATPDTAVAVCAREGAGAGRGAGGRGTELLVGPAGELLVGPAGDGRPAHGADLLPLIERAVAEAGGWERIGKIAVGVGPGSFTGVRIGVATARALAQARSLPLVGVSSPAAVCAGIARADPEATERIRIGVVDARRGELFASIDRGTGPEPPVLAAPEELAAALGLGSSGLKRKPLAAGDGAVRSRAQIEASGIEVPADGDPAHRVSALLICALGRDLEGGPPEAVTPNYLRRPDAERWIDGRRGN